MADREDTVLTVDRLMAGYDDRAVLDRLSVSIERGTITALVGPNGSGKSTLLKTMARLLRPTGGSVYLDGKAINHLSTTEVARQLAILPQSATAPAGLTVRELVEQGRFPHVGALRMLRPQDHAAIREALALTQMTDFAHRPLSELSGGERQRAWIALTLAQDAPTLLLDEPTTFLDIGYQMEVMELITRLNRERGMTILLVLHDLNQAAQYAHRMIVLQRGQVVADGAPGMILTPGLLEAVFRVRATVVTDPMHGTPVCLPYASLNGPVAVRQE